jgi:hypothetical protein
MWYNQSKINRFVVSGFKNETSASFEKKYGRLYYESLITMGFESEQNY